MAKIPTNKLTIYLIKESYTKPEDILGKYTELTEEDIKYKTNTIGTLYYGDSQYFEPAWIEDFFNDSFNNKKYENVPKSKLFSATSKAVLLVKQQGRIFAIPFGYGWTLLNHGVWEERFGLKTALNIVDADSLRRIDKKNMSSVPKDTSEQLSRGGVAADFGIDIEQDLVQSITGKTIDETFGKNITGKDALSVSVKVDLTNIKDFLETCYQTYLKTDYKKDFGWIDQIADIKDPKLIETLDGQLIENIKNNQEGKTWMAVPELVKWEEVSGFSYKNSARPKTQYDDINLSAFINSLSDASEDDKNKLSIEILKKKKIYCFDSQNDSLKHQWSAYNCMYCEINDRTKEKTYLLSNGKWYEVEKSFTKSVDKEYQALRNQAISIDLPSYQHGNENDYNIKIAQKDKQFCCMDRKNISHGGGYSKIEFCDLFAKNKKMIHVKHYGGSSVLSHLFNQGIVSGELFIRDEDFRKKVSAKLSKAHRIFDIENKPKASDYEVVFAVISSVENDLEIPFFSKVALKNAKQKLETYGYKVSLQKIKSEK
ncbi:TIGR04141 family sporadically distributed protein [bacterium]|nr:TIGR04141 family sporadically distributed protein [bacterium]